jgi:copper chaperone
MARSVLNVEGMSCSHCKMTVEKAAGSLPGVAGAQVSLQAGSLTVEYDEKKVNLAKIKEAVREAGYEVA